MMKLPVFFARYLLGIYIAGVLILFLVAMVDFFVGVFTKKYYSDKHRESFATRVGSILIWPFLIPSRRGRKLLAQSWRNIF